MCLLSFLVRKGDVGLDAKVQSRGKCFCFCLGTGVVVGKCLMLFQGIGFETS